MISRDHKNIKRTWHWEKWEENKQVLQPKTLVKMEMQPFLSDDNAFSIWLHIIIESGQKHMLWLYTASVLASKQTKISPVLKYNKNMKRRKGWEANNPYPENISTKIRKKIKWRSKRISLHIISRALLKHNRSLTSIPTLGYLAASLGRCWLMRAHSGTPCLYKCRNTQMPGPALLTFST